MSIAKEMRAWRARVAAMRLRLTAIEEALAAPAPWLADWEYMRTRLEAEREALHAMMADSPYGDLNVQQERSTFESLHDVTIRVIDKLKVDK